jgi:hypothetical protein
MSHKLTALLPIAILLGTVSVAPALAQTPSHHLVQPNWHTSVSPATFGSDAYDSYGMQPSQGRLPGETPALPFTQDPDSPQGW